LDLYWEVDTGAARYVHIANVKWRRPSGRAQLQDVELLDHIRAKVRAQKAFLLTNTGFSDGAEAAALDAGIGLYIVRPQPAAREGKAGSREAMLKRLCALKQRSGAGALFTYQVIQKGIELPLFEWPVLASGAANA